MAVYPCDVTGHRYVQPQQSIYFTRLYGQEAETYKLRYCPRHFDECLTLIMERAFHVEDDSMGSSVCQHCDEDRTGGYSIKVFPQHEEPDYYFADLCDRCMVALEHDLKISNGRRLTER